LEAIVLEEEDINRWLLVLVMIGDTASGLKVMFRLTYALIIMANRI
jgi:hypothetical protein